MVKSLKGKMLEVSPNLEARWALSMHGFTKSVNQLQAENTGGKLHL
jgi:hypothetical protein